MTPRELLIDALKTYGVVGVDAEGLIDELPDLGVDEREEFAEEHDWSPELEEAREADDVEACGCDWVRLPLPWWAAELVREWGMPREQADAIVELLAGSAS